MQNNLILRLANKMYVDWFLFVPAIIISLAGLITMNSFYGENYFFFRQSIWLLVSVSIFFVATAIDWRFLRQTNVIMVIFGFTISALATLLFVGKITRGVQSWFQIGALAFQPSDLARLVVVLILSKYFSRRHIEIKNFRHILISGLYAFIIFSLVFFQPDFGGAMIIFGLWLGMISISGISKKHLAILLVSGIATAFVLWAFVFAPYQKARIVSFLNPLADIHGAGYNAYQSTVAVGSGEILGKGIGEGSQSKLQFLPEYETDFIFAAFTEEWGFIGALTLLILCLALVMRVVDNARLVATNFETFFSLGFVILISIHVAIHAGMNMGILPVTGIIFPFMSYGGSHLVTEWLALGIISSMKRHSQGPRL